MQLALKQRGLRDDVSVVVLDVVPNQEARLAPGLEKSSTASGVHDHVEVRHPLRGTGLANTWCADTHPPSRSPKNETYSFILKKERKWTEEMKSKLEVQKDLNIKYRLTCIQGFS